MTNQKISRIAAAYVSIAVAIGLAAAGPHHGAVNGVWRQSTYDRLTLHQDKKDHITGVYAFKDGRIEGQVSGRTLTGLWSQSSAGERCDAERLGSHYWGKVKLTASRDGRSFDGKWGYCDAAPTDGWSGTR